MYMYKYEVKNDMYTCMCTPGAHKIKSTMNSSNKIHPYVSSQASSQDIKSVTTTCLTITPLMCCPCRILTLAFTFNQSELLHVFIFFFYYSLHGTSCKLYTTFISSCLKFCLKGGWHDYKWYILAHNLNTIEPENLAVWRISRPAQNPPILSHFYILRTRRQSCIAKQIGGCGLRTNSLPGYHSLESLLPRTDPSRLRFRFYF